MKKILIPGGSGFLGRALIAALPRDEWEVVVLTRDPGADSEGVTQRAWDGRSAGDWSQDLEGAVAVVNLAGRSINTRFTARNRSDIMDSRVHSVRAIGESIARCSDPPQVWVQASAVGYYGDSGDEILGEGAPAGLGFVADVCRIWEEELQRAPVPETRKVVLRIGPVLGRGGGALERLLPIVKRYAGGRVGNGRQYFSWIHLRDLVRLILWALENDTASGVYNAVASHAVTNSVLMGALRKSVGVPVGLPAPALAVRLAAPILGVDPSLALEGQRCAPLRATEQGFEFHFSDLPDALADLLV